MQHFKEFLIRIQTFNLRVNKQDRIMKDGLKNEKRPMSAYSMAHETQLSISEWLLVPVA